MQWSLEMKRYQFDATCIHQWNQVSIPNLNKKSRHHICLNVNFAVDVNIVNETCLELDFFSHCELVEMFLNTALETGIDLDAKAHHGLTTMHYACMDRYEMRALSRQRLGL